MRRFCALAFGLVALVVAATACEPVNPPEVVGGTQNPVTFGANPDVGTVATASAGSKRVVLWGNADADLRVDRFDGATVPQDPQPASVASPDTSSNEDATWGPSAAALGNGYALLAATESISGPHGDFFSEAAVGLRSPTNQGITLSGPGANDLAFCEFGEPPDAAVAWNGTQFLLSKGCSDGAHLFTVTTGGVVTARATLANAHDLVLSRSGGGFLATYVVNGTGSDVKAQRLDGNGAKVGSTLAIAGGTGNQRSPSAAPSGTTNLVVWETDGSGGNGTDLAARTVSSTGTLGAVHALAARGGDQVDPTVTGSSGGTWLTAWNDELDTDIVGTDVHADGTPENEFPITLAGGAGPQTEPILTPGASGTAFLTWIDSATGKRLDFVKKIRPDSIPFGPTTRSTREPFPQTCADVAAGNGQFLAVWQEARVTGNTNLFARRFGPDGLPRGGLISLSTAGGDQFCPRAAWNGSNWLVVWTDRRNGTTDVFGALVSGSGAVNPSSGFAISARASEQQSPEVTWNGTDFVVTWNDLRNGNQDIYAARVRPDRTVRDPNGLAVTTAAGAQRMPTIASSGGPTLIAWVSDAGVQRRILRPNGTFIGGVVTEGTTPFGSFGQAVAAASPSRLGVVFAPSFSSLVFAAIDPSNGSKTGQTTLATFDEGDIWVSSDIAWDGSRFVLRTTTANSDTVSSSVQLQSLTGTTVASAGTSFQYNGAIASLPSGRSLVLGTRQQTLLTAAVADAP
jgi:hypothetical protein